MKDKKLPGKLASFFLYQHTFKVLVRRYMDTKFRIAAFLLKVGRNGIQPTYWNACRHLVTTPEHFRDNGQFL